MVEIAYQDWTHPFLRKTDIERHREGLLVGCCAEEGEIYQGILSNPDDTLLETIAGFYDYLEVMPPECYALLPAKERFPSNRVFEMEDIVCQTIAVGKRAKKLVAAVGNTRIIEQEDMDAYCILSGKDMPPAYFRSKENMLNTFSFLDKKTAKQVVVETPNRIADLCENIEIFPDNDVQLCPLIPGAFQRIESICWKRITTLYGEHTPWEAEGRLEHELSMLHSQEASCSQLLIVRHLVQGLRRKKHLVSSSNCIAASYIAYLLEIADIDPLALNIPCETLFGLDGERDLDIVLNISGPTGTWCW